MFSKIDYLLFSPSKKIEDPLEQYRAKLLTILVFTFWSAQIADAVFLSIYNTEIPGFEKTSAVVALSVGFFVETLAYIACRTSRFRVGCYLNILSNTLGVILAAVLYPNPSLIINALPWLLANTLLAGTVLSNQETVGIAISSIVICYCMKFVNAEVITPHVYMLVHYIASLSIIGVLITILRNRADKLAKEQQSKLFQASKLTGLGEMAGAIAHEINTPLTALRLMTEYNKKKLNTVSEKSIQEVQSKLDRTIEVIDKIAKTVKSLRSISRSSSDEEIEPTPLSQIIEDTLSLSRQRFEQANIRLELVPPEIPSHVILECNPVQISQVLLNLLNNAFDAVSEIETKWVRIGWEATHNSLILRVTDSGLGIDEKIKNKLFQPFVTTKPLGKGTGIGLSISKTIMESHHGIIYLDKTSQHTSFVIQLPFIRATRLNL